MKIEELYDYLIKYFGEDEPIFLSEIPGKSENSKAQDMKKLVDCGKIKRFQNGVFYRTYLTPIGTEGKMSVDKFIEKRYLNIEGEISGYITGLGLANMAGLTSQNSAITEVRSNAATTGKRNLEIGKRRLVVYRPLTKVTAENRIALQFLDLMSTMDRYAEFKKPMIERNLRRFIKAWNVDFEQVKKYLPLYPDRTYRNIYEGGLMNELV